MVKGKEKEKRTCKSVTISIYLKVHITFTKEANAYVSEKCEVVGECKVHLSNQDESTRHIKSTTFSSCLVKLI